MKKRAKKLVSTLLFSILAAESVAACGGAASSGATPVKPEKKVEDVADFFTKGINQFSYRIFEKLDKDENIVISPYSMAVAIGMLENGADGDTKQEIETLLGIKDLEEWNASAKYYMSLYEKEQTKLLTANSVWFSDKLELAEQAEDTFFNPLQTYYGAEKQVMELSADKAREKINQWISKKTKGEIDPFLAENIQNDIEMLLVNAVYFKGKWAEKFDTDNTITDTFYGSKNTTKVSYMKQFGKEYRYVEQNGIRGVELPYEGENIVMDIFIPEKKGENISDLFGALQTEEKEALLKELSDAKTQNINTLAIPKFLAEYGVEDISNALKELGMKKAFLPGDFERIADGIFADSVLHKAKIEVDETGTTAAAATMVEMRMETACLSEKTEFIADQPFLYMIRDVKKDMILFMGSVRDLPSVDGEAENEKTEKEEEKACILAAKEYIDSQMPEEKDNITNYSNPSVELLDEEPETYYECKKNYEPNGKIYRVIFETKDDALLGPIACLVDEEGVAFGMLYRE